jgi:predicted porin
MQKESTVATKLGFVLAAAITLPVPALADTANVSIYGVANLSYDYIRTGTAANGTPGISKTNVSSNVSRIGFKGSEDLGGGLSAIWQIEQQVNMDNAGGTFATRNSFAGMKSGNLGTLLLGRHDTPYKLTTRKLDVFADSIADNRALLGGVKTNKSSNAGFDERQPDLIAYTSPSVSGFIGMIARVNLTEGNTASTAAKASATSLAAMYDAAPFYGSIGYEVHKLDTALAGGKESATKLGLGYTMDALTLGFAYEKTSDNLGAGAAATVGAACAAKAAGSDCFGHTAYYLSGLYKLDSDAVKFAYGKAGQLGNTANTGANQLSVGYDHGLGKRTVLYALYSRISNQSGINYGFSQSSATANNATINGTGASPSALSIGVKHSF